MKYTGSTKVSKGDTVSLMVDDEVYHTGKVYDALASQFTIKVKTKTRFFFYEDKGITWKVTT